jgi:hypothetical protein
MPEAAAVIGRRATLKLSAHDTVTARIPAGASAEEFARVAQSSFDLISKLTGHPCYSGRFKLVIEDPFLNEAIQVDLKTGAPM